MFASPQTPHGTIRFLDTKNQFMQLRIFILLFPIYFIPGWLFTCLPARPTLFTTFELRNPSQDVPELSKLGRSPDLKALKLWKGRPGDCKSSQASRLPASIDRAIGATTCYSLTVHFTVFVALKSGDSRTLCNQETSYDLFWAPKF